MKSTFCCNFERIWTAFSLKLESNQRGFNLIVLAPCRTRIVKTYKTLIIAENMGVKTS